MVISVSLVDEHTIIGFPTICFDGWIENYELVNPHISVGRGI